MSQARITISDNTIPCDYSYKYHDKNASWRMVKLKDHGNINVRIGWKNLKQSEYTKSGPYLISGKHIKDGKINWDICDHISMERYDESPEIALKENDIIFSKDGTLGNPVIIRHLKKKATINATMMLIRLKSEVHPGYFFQVLKSKYFDKFLHIHATKSGIDHILVNDFENFTFPITDIEKQKQITIILETIDKKIAFIEKNYKNHIKKEKTVIE